jgi:uncharacterized membrane protein
MSELIHSPLYILTVLAGSVFISEWILRFRFFKRFGAALIAIILTAIIANLGFLPTSSNPVYDSIFNYIAPASIFLLLLDVNLTELKKVGIPMLLLFFMGTLGTTVGVITATFIIPESPLFEGTYSALAGMLAGTFTGGSINFNAVAIHYRVMENGLVYASTIAVDNIVTALWMFVTIALPGFLMGRKHVKKTANIDKPAPEQKQPLGTIRQLSLLILLTIGAVWISEFLATYFSSIGIRIPMIVIITTLALILAQIKSISLLPGNQLFGSWLVYLFLAVIGAFCDIGAFAEAGKLASVILAFVLIIFAVHALFMVIAKKTIPSDWDEIAIASQANIGGATTAMALAQNFNRHELVLPAIIIGTLGNAIGTYIGFLIAFNI